MSEEIVIEKGIPMPDRRPKYPLQEMEVGDSFELSDEADPRKLRGSVYQYGRRYGRDFSVIKTGEESYRVWRTA